VAPVPLLVLASDGELSRADGGILVAWFGVAMLALARTSRGLVTPTEPGGRPRRAVARLLGGLGVLTAGGVVLGDGLRRAVSDLGVSQTVLGNTAVAAAVEAEEVGRVVVPARRGRADVGVANIAGTIVHFAALNAGIIALVRPLHLDAASRHLHLPVCAGATALLALVLWRGRGIGRAMGVALVSLYAGYVAAAIAVG
jgi:cation:H+ antiporter